MSEPTQAGSEEQVPAAVPADLAAEIVRLAHQWYETGWGKDVVGAELELAIMRHKNALATSAQPAAVPADLADLVHKMHYAAYSWGFEAGKVGQHVDTTIAGNKADAALKAVLAALAASPSTLSNDGGAE